MKNFLVITSCLIVMGCSASSSSSSAKPTEDSVDNRATRYVEGLQTDLQSARTVAEEESQQNKERESQYKDLLNQ